MLFHITLKPVTNWPHPPVQCLRLALKRLKRNYGLQCVMVREDGQATVVMTSRGKYDKPKPPPPP